MSKSDNWGEVVDVAATSSTRSVSSTPRQQEDQIHHPDRLTVQVAGARPFLVSLDEVGLKQTGINVVPEARRDKNATMHWRLAHRHFSALDTRACLRSRRVKCCVHEAPQSTHKWRQRGRQRDLVAG
jgi:hypothetical protein